MERHEGQACTPAPRQACTPREESERARVRVQVRVRERTRERQRERKPCFSETKVAKKQQLD